MSDQWGDQFSRTPTPTGPAVVTLGHGWYFDGDDVYVTKAGPDGKAIITKMPMRFEAKPGDVLRIEAEGTTIRITRDGKRIVMREGRMLPRHRRARLRL